MRMHSLDTKVRFLEIADVIPLHSLESQNLL
ncbi:Uncharacterised protein [Streptococcus pneumoniae]|nr:Uncharacterised protein [Streptococcus pneumoniae]